MTRFNVKKLVELKLDRISGIELNPKLRNEVGMALKELDDPYGGGPEKVRPSVAVECVCASAAHLLKCINLRMPLVSLDSTGQLN